MKHPRLTTLMFASIAGFSIVLAGCGGDTGTASSADTTGSTEPSAAQVATIEPGILTVCATGAQPFGYQTDQGDWTGFDIDLLEAMATDINGGLELSVTVLPLSGIWLAPADDTCDVVAAALTITPETGRGRAVHRPLLHVGPVTDGAAAAC